MSGSFTARQVLFFTSADHTTKGWPCQVVSANAGVVQVIDLAAGEKKSNTIKELLDFPKVHTDSMDWFKEPVHCNTK